MKQFEDMTIGELKKLHEQYLQQHPEIKTVGELLEEKVEWCSNCETNYPRGKHDMEMCKYLNR